ncbi:SRPBCC domain-containing protein [Glycocaulis profundi]|nr:SRPBCC domain-containing protein [Glycocaulis profundi]
MTATAAAEERFSLTLQRRLKAAPERVWRAWTDASCFPRWFGPEGAEVSHAEADVREGGRFNVVFSIPPDPEVHDVSGTYLAVEPVSRLVFTWRWITLPDRQSQVTILIRPDGAGSLLILSHEQLFDEAARDGHRQGWTGCLDRLEAFVHGGRETA